MSGLLFGACTGLLAVPLMFLAGIAAVGLWLSLPAGVLLGLALGAFTFVMSRRFRSKIPLREGEVLIHQGRANHFVCREAVGGWLCLTDRRLLFVSHAVNHFVHGWEAPLGEVHGAAACMSKWIIANGLTVSTTEGDRRFAVEGRKAWRPAIEAALNGRRHLLSDR